MHIFIAFPFSQLIETKTGLLSKNNIFLLENLRNRLIEDHHQVFLAHYREKWGKALMLPAECTTDDFNEMKKTDLVLAFPGWPISGGVHIELGWASALGKKIVLILKNKTDYSPLVYGLEAVTDTEIINYDILDYKEILPKILKYVNSIEGKKTA